jgi:hypothetical protein
LLDGFALMAGPAVIVSAIVSTITSVKIVFFIVLSFFVVL